MPQCPKCSYKLVFLENRLKYKCAKCGRVFLQKFIENKDFQRWNTFQRELDKDNLELEQKQIRDLIEERNIFRGLRLLFKEKRIKLKLEERKQRKAETDRIWRENNIERIHLNDKLWLSKNKDKKLAYLRLWRKNNQEKARLKQRLGYWRLQQARLSQKELEANGYSLNNPYLEGSFSTFGLSDQLFK